jgi:hypothetical protein
MSIQVINKERERDENRKKDKAFLNIQDYSSDQLNKNKISPKILIE